MQVIKNTDGTLVALSDEFKVIGPKGSVLSNSVVIAKRGSENKGETATIEAIRNNKVVVDLDNGDGYRTYTFAQLKNSRG